jgi:hypothetical protein
MFYKNIDDVGNPWEFLLSRAFLLFLVWTLTLYMLYVAYGHVNVAPYLIGAIGTGIGLWLVLRAETILVSALFVIAGSFVFMPIPLGHVAIDRPSGTSFHTDAFVAGFHPFRDSTKYYFETYSVQFTRSHNGHPIGNTCYGETADRARVRGIAGAELHLPSSGVQKAHMIAGSHARLMQLAKSAVCGRFKRVVAQHTVATLPSTLALAAMSVEDTQEVNDLGLLYYGAVQIGGLDVLKYQQEDKR